MFETLLLCLLFLGYLLLFFDNLYLYISHLFGFDLLLLLSLCFHLKYLHHIYLLISLDYLIISHLHDLLLLIIYDHIRTSFSFFPLLYNGGEFYRKSKKKITFFYNIYHQQIASKIFSNSYFAHRCELRKTFFYFNI